MIYNGVDIGAIEDSSMKPEFCGKYDSLFSDRESKVFIHVGRFVKVKNQVKLIKGFALAKSKCSGMKLIMVGDGGLLEPAKRLVHHLGLEESIIFTGLVPREEVYSLMKRSDGFVMNSRSEGLSVALLEAMAMGLPCILSDIHSFRETTRGSDIGEFVTGDRPMDVADAFLRFMSTDCKKLAEKGREARALVEKYYSYDVMVSAYKDLYTELMEEYLRR